MRAISTKLCLFLLLAGSGCTRALDYAVIDEGGNAVNLLNTNEIILDAHVTTVETIDNELQLKEQGDGVPDYHEALIIIDAVLKGRYDARFLRLTLRPLTRDEANSLDPIGAGFRYDLPLRIGFDRGSLGRVRNLRFKRSPTTRPTSQ